MKNFSYTCILCLFLFSGITQDLEIKPFSIGETLSFYSEILNESRDINIYLPTNYHPDSSKTYPVIYLLDGSKDEDFIHISGLVQFCSFSWINIIEESIVVGIANVDRKRDFTYPSTVERDRIEFPMTGHSAKFISFIEKELKPLIEKQYKLSEETTLIGQSLGGLLATEILIGHPEMFKNYIIISPSLWWDDENLLKIPTPETLEKKSVYIGVGNEGPLMTRVAKTLFYKLSLEKTANLNVFFEYFDKQSHGDVLHLAVYDAFQKIFMKKPK